MQRTSTLRVIDRSVKFAAAVMAVTMSAYHLYTGFVGAPVPEIHYPLHLLFTFAVLHLSNVEFGESVRQRLRALWSLGMLVLSLTATGYLLWNASRITNRMVMVEPMTFMDTAMGVIMVLAILEAARRLIGWPVVIIGVVGILYTFAGPYLPVALANRGYSMDRVIEYLYFTNEGIFSSPVAVMASYVFHFVLLGSFLVATGAGAFFTDLAALLTRKLIGGTAKASIVASALMGMLSGSSAGNVVTTGSFTIPAMRKNGFNARFAAAVEAVASSGGQLTPPIMGAAAFIMAEVTGIPYVHIISAAIIPAFLYFAGVFFTVDLEARRLNLSKEVTVQSEVTWRDLGRRSYLVMPLAVMLYLLIDGWSPTTAAVYSIATLLALLVTFDPVQRRRIHLVLWDAMSSAPRLIAPVTIACAVGGVLVGIIGLTGLGLRVSGIILDVTGDQLFLTLVLTMIVGVVLGIGMPTSGAYIVLATLLAPGLIDAGVVPIAAHMFVLFSAAKSSITPPVAIASYAAAAIAEADPWKTSIVAFKLGLSVFLIPFIYAYNPALLGEGPTIEIVWAVCSTLVGVFALSVVTVGWLLVPLGVAPRLFVAVATLCLLFVGKTTDLIGLGMIVLVFIHCWHRQKSVPKEVTQ